jgi:cyclopropane fatty-acyl-phospholipid synthase-like methyltransferase
LNFDKKWETEIYKKKRQINKYPFDSIVSAVSKNFKNKRVNGSYALDLGCGAGNNLKFLINFGFKKVTGIDGSNSAIKEVKKTIKTNKCELICADFNDYYLGNNKFELIIDRGSITHNTKENINKIFNNIKIALKNNGIFISHLFSQKHSEFKNYKSKKMFKNSMKVSTGMIANFFSKKEIVHLFKDFKILSINHAVETDIFTKEVTAFWYIVAKNK